MSDVLSQGIQYVIRERTLDEKYAYLAGYRTGVKAGAKHGLEVALSHAEVIESTLAVPPNPGVDFNPEQT